MSGVQFEWSINLGQMITILFTVAGVIGAFYRIHTEVVVSRVNGENSAERLDKRIGSIESKVNEITAATIAIARQDERMKGIEHRLASVEEDLGLLTRPQV